MSQIMEWPCAKCGTLLSDVHVRITRKYCNDCQKVIKKEIQKRRNDARPRKNIPSIADKLLYLLKTNGKATRGEIISFCGENWHSIRTIMVTVRKNYVIDLKKGFYYYGGKK